MQVGPITSAIAERPDNRHERNCGVGILTEQIRVERDRIVSDIDNVEKGILDLQLMIAEGRISPQRAELAAAQSNDELRRLKVRLADLDASILLKQGAQEFDE